MQTTSVVLAQLETVVNTSTALHHHSHKGTDILVLELVHQMDLWKQTLVNKHRSEFTIEQRSCLILPFLNHSEDFLNRIF